MRSLLSFVLLTVVVSPVVAQRARLNDNRSQGLSAGEFATSPSAPSAQPPADTRNPSVSLAPPAHAEPHGQPHPGHLNAQDSELKTQDSGLNTQDAPIPLAPPGESSTSRLRGGASSIPIPDSAKTIVIALAVVLGLFFLLVWFSRRAGPAAPGKLPPEAVETLGYALLAPKQHVQLLRVGHKLLLLAVTQHGVSTLTEINRPEEVDRLMGLCRSSQPGSISAAFRQVLAQVGDEPTSSEFAETGQRQNRRSSRTSASSS